MSNLAQRLQNQKDLEAIHPHVHINGESRGRGDSLHGWGGRMPVMAGACKTCRKSR